VDIAAEAVFLDFLTEDGISFTQNKQLLFSDIADNTNSKSRPGKRLAPDEIAWYAKLESGFANFIFK
jgi:hypothetical protein